ncbi:MAG TPA: cell division protein FtsZ [bacterium]|nr:cell division protein FtsZ [bacterium]
MMRIRPEEQNMGAVKIKVVGVGGAGGNVVSRMVERLSGVDLAAINTDSQALAVNAAPIKLQIGRRLTEGLGTGANPEMGKFAANEDRAQIGELMKGADLVFLTLGLGGGTGTGAGPVVAKIAKDNGAVVVGFVTQPFGFEGGIRRDVADRGLGELKKQLDTLVVVSNEKILEIVPKNTSLEDAFARVDDILYQGVAALTDLITQPGLINVDFADLRSIILEGGEGILGTGSATGENRAEEAARLAISNPFLKREELVSARKILVNVSGPKELGIFEMRRAVEVIDEALSPYQGERFCGAVIDPALNEEMKVTVIATGLERVGLTGMVTAEAVPADRPPTPPRPPRPNKRNEETDKREVTLFNTNGETGGGASPETANHDIPAYLRQKNSKGQP